MEAAAAKSIYEMERGKPIPSKNHAIVQGNIYFLLRQKYEPQYRFLPEVSIVVGGQERIPDIAVYPPLDFSPGRDEVRLEEVPLSIVEILSPQQHLTDLIAKSYQYFEAGIRSYWLVLPDLTTVYVFSSPDEYEVFAKKGVIKDPALGIELPVEAIFR
jgi:Uma2 family endonuclease